MKVTGWLADDAPILALEGVFVDTGQYGVQQMKEITSETDHTKRLSNSLMFKTAKSRMNIDNPADEITAPTRDDELYIGSGAPHATYRETYSGIHQSSEGSPEFIELLKKWAEDVLGINPTGAPEDQDRWEALLAHVRDNKTEGNPFIEPNVRAIAEYAAKRVPHSVNIYLKKVANKQKDIK